MNRRERNIFGDVFRRDENDAQYAQRRAATLGVRTFLNLRLQQTVKLKDSKSGKVVEGTVMDVGSAHVRFQIPMQGTLALDEKSDCFLSGGTVTYTPKR